MLVNHHTKLLVRTAAPLGVLAILVGGAVVLQRAKVAKWLSNRLLEIAFFVVFLVYPSASATIFGTFPCITLDDGSQFLRADPSIDCTSPTHAGYVAYAAVMLFVYPIGTPLLCAGLMWRHRGPSPA